MEKLKVLIVDDEIVIARLIQSLIDYEKLNLTSIGIAADGETALRLIEKHQPQIVITDISMPGISGLDMIQRILSNPNINYKPRVIILSGYNSFQYAVNGIKMGVEDYLLKPINKEDLNHVLTKTITKISEDLHLENHLKKLNVKIYAQQQKLRSMLMKDILYDRFPANETIDQLIRDYHYKFSQGSIYMAGIVHCDGLDSFALSIKSGIIRHLMHYFRGSISDICLDAEIHGQDRQFIFLITLDPENQTCMRENLSANLMDMANYVAEYDKNILVSITCGIPVRETKSIPYSLKTAANVLDARLLLGSCHVLYADRILLKAQGKTPSFQITKSVKNELISKIELKDEAAARSILLQIYQDVTEACKPSPALIKQSFQQTTANILTILNNFIKQNPSEFFYKYNDGIEPFYTVDELTGFTLDFICRLLDPFQQDQIASKPALMYKIKQYIDEHYMENLKLEDLASVFYLSSNYFGTLFKKLFGESFSTYLINVRLEKAKILLQDPQYSITQIAYAVGYHDKRYFTGLFKSTVGITPKEYRKIYLN